MSHLIGLGLLSGALALVAGPPPARADALTAQRLVLTSQSAQSVVRVHGYYRGGYGYRGGHYGRGWGGGPGFYGRGYVAPRVYPRGWGWGYPGYRAPPVYVAPPYYPPVSPYGVYVNPY